MLMWLCYCDCLDIASLKNYVNMITYNYLDIA